MNGKSVGRGVANPLRYFSVGGGVDGADDAVHVVEPREVNLVRNGAVLIAVPRSNGADKNANLFVFTADDFYGVVVAVWLVAVSVKNLGILCWGHWVFWYLLIGAEGVEVAADDEAVHIGKAGIPRQPPHIT